DQVQAALARDQVLIELIRYDHYLGKNNFESRYGAVAISSTGEPTWTCLGRAEEIEATIALYRSSARGRTDEETLQGVLHALQARVWAPIEDVLPEGTKRIVLSPDGQLNFVSFATLLGTDDKFLAEK